MSNTQIFTLLVAAGIVVLAVAIIIGIRMTLTAWSKRSAHLQKMAAGLGFSFNKRPDRSLIDALADSFLLFNLGDRSGEFRNLMEGEIDGHRAVIFDYGYAREIGDEIKNVNHTVAMMDSDHHMPAFVLRHEGLGDKFRCLVRAHDIELAHDPDFSRNCWLAGPEPEEIKRFFDPDTTRRFRDRDRLRGKAIESDGSRLLFYHVGHVSPEELCDFVEQSGEMARLFDRAA